jgi:hypothetical protein
MRCAEGLRLLRSECLEAAGSNSGVGSLVVDQLAACRISLGFAALFS